MKVKVAEVEEKCIEDNTDMNRMAYNGANSQLIMNLKKGEAYWRQKSRMQWFKEGDVNSKFFHTLMSYRRRRLFIKNIKVADDTWVEGNDAIAMEVIKHFEAQFSEDNSFNDFSYL